MLNLIQHQLIIDQYKILKSQKKVSTLTGFSRGTINKVLRENNIIIQPPGHQTKHNIPMIMHDWNARMSITKITDTYGFSCEEVAYKMISRWRKQGWDFSRRDRVKK